MMIAYAAAQAKLDQCDESDLDRGTSRGAR
jgi:hypothetical protein